MIVHLVDGTYELFRHYYAVPSRTGSDGSEVGAVRGVVSSVLQMLEDGATHLGVATDHVIESFRNDLFSGYKTGEGIDPALRSQFEPLEAALEALGVAVWAETTYEADDALAAAAAVAAADERVERVFICTPDKDLAQCVVGERVVQLDRRARVVRDEAGVREKFGVSPSSIPDYLALVGDSADGIPGLAGWGAKTAAAVLSVYGRIEAIPTSPGQWDVPGLRGAAKLAATLAGQLSDVLLYRRLAQLERVGPEVGTVNEWRWSGPTPAFAEVCAGFGAAGFARRAERLAAERGRGAGPG